MGRAVVEPVDHPGHGGLVSNTKPVLTSPVVAIYDNGEFETENTYYAPEIGYGAGAEEGPHGRYQPM
jgi:hypothetical protein